MIYLDSPERRWTTITEGWEPGPHERKTDAIRFGNRLGATQMVRIDTEEMREANLFYGLRS